MSNFDELLELQESEETDNSPNFKPIWKLKSKEDIHSWLKAEFRRLSKINNNRFSTMMENLLIYQGIQFSPDDQKTLNDFLDTSSLNENRRKQKLIVNHLFDLTETIISRNTRNRPQPEVLPANSNQTHDRNASKAVQQLLNYIAYINRLSKKDIDNKRLSLICGESYASVLWNKDLGDLHPAYAEAKLNNFVNEDGSPILSPVNNKPLSDENIIRTGEVEVKIREPWKLLFQDKDSYEDSDYAFMMELILTDELKADFPKSKNEIKPIDSSRIFDSQKMTFRKPRNESLKITFFHKKTKYLPKGMQVIFTLETILELIDLPYDHRQLPFARLTDIDVPNQMHGISFYEMAKSLQWRHNQLSSDIITNQRMCAKPKWIVPKGRCNLKQLGNDITIVQFSGSIPPRLEVPNPTPQEIFTFRDKLKDDLEQISTVTGTARRDPPTGVTASVAMRFLSELEAERVSVSISKHNEFIRDVYILMMSVAGKFYDKDDGRTMRVLGNDQDYQIVDIELSNLNKPYDVIIRNTGSLPETRAAKESRIFEILEKKPDLLTDAQLIDVLDVGAVDKMTTIVTESLRAAESENESIFQGKEIPEPAPYEDSITHWKTHLQKIQSYAIKINTDPKDFTVMEEHIWGTEFLMTEKAKENPTFQAELANLKLFPIYYRDGKGFVPSSKAHQQAVVQGQANKGEEITERIGGDVAEANQIDNSLDINKEK